MASRARRPVVAGNWKMNHLADDGVRFCRTLSASTGFRDGVDVLLFPPATLLMVMHRVLAGTGVALGGQTCHHAASGAFTGEIAPAMLRDAGCTHVLVGHSERRRLFGETDEVVSKKLRAAADGGLVPVLCVGETEAEREADRTRDVLARQLGALDGWVTQHALLVAYEPVWAIGTGRTATPDQAQAAHAFVRAEMARRLGDVAREMRVLYGGSVTAANFAALLAQPDVDGALVGGASLAAESFLELIAIAAG